MHFKVPRNSEKVFFVIETNFTFVNIGLRCSNSSFVDVRSYLSSSQPKHIGSLLNYRKWPRFNPSETKQTLLWQFHKNLDLSAMANLFSPPCKSYNWNFNFLMFNCSKSKLNKDDKYIIAVFKRLNVRFV